MPNTLLSAKYFRMELNVDWSSLPTDVVMQVMSYLPPRDRNHASRVCHAWHEAFEHPALWQSFDFWFFLPAHEQSLECARKYGKYMKRIFIGVNQMLKHNRENACALLEVLSRIGRRKITHIEIVFTGENPLFYSGQEFLDGLCIFFSPIAKEVEPPLNTLQHVDLCGLSVPIDEHVIDALSENHRDLKFLDIQNKVIVCKVTSACILRLVQRCQRLRDLRVYHFSMSDDILNALADDKRGGEIEHLSIMCRREVKYGIDLSDECWEKLTSRVPTLRVTLGFDHTCPFNLIPVIMKSIIPVRTLKLETFAECHDEVNKAATYYSNTLLKLVLRTRNTRALEEALLNVARTCTRLRALLVFCVVSPDVIEEIFRLHPDIKSRGTYILKSEVEPEPWVVGVEEGD